MATAEPVQTGRARLGNAASEICGIVSGLTMAATSATKDAFGGKQHTATRP